MPPMLMLKVLIFLLMNTAWSQTCGNLFDPSYQALHFELFKKMQNVELYEPQKISTAYYLEKPGVKAGFWKNLFSRFMTNVDVNRVMQTYFARHPQEKHLYFKIKKWKKPERENYIFLKIVADTLQRLETDLLDGIRPNEADFANQDANHLMILASNTVKRLVERDISYLSVHGPHGNRDLITYMKSYEDRAFLAKKLTEYEDFYKNFDVQTAYRTIGLAPFKSPLFKDRFDFEGQLSELALLQKYFYDVFYHYQKNTIMHQRESLNTYKVMQSGMPEQNQIWLFYTSHSYSLKFLEAKLMLAIIEHRALQLYWSYKQETSSSLRSLSVREQRAYDLAFSRNQIMQTLQRLQQVYALLKRPDQSL